MNDLKCSIEHHLEAYNQYPKPFRLHKKTEGILAYAARAARVMVK
ncbi:hypothetical protein EMIT0324P_170059 [Pseudomonas chlororaphis]